MRRLGFIVAELAFLAFFLCQIVPTIDHAQAGLNLANITGNLVQLYGQPAVNIAVNFQTTYAQNPQGGGGSIIPPSRLTVYTDLNGNLPNPAWQASTVHAAGDQIVDSNGNTEVAQSSGTTGSSTPVWPVIVGNTVVDSGVTWKLTMIGTTACTPSVQTNCSVQIPQSATVLLTIGNPPVVAQPLPVQVPLNVVVDIDTMILAVTDPPSLVSSIATTTGGVTITNPAAGSVGIATLNFSSGLLPPLGSPGQYIVENAAGTAWVAASMSGDATSSITTPAQVQVNQSSNGEFLVLNHIGAGGSLTPAITSCGSGALIAGSTDYVFAIHNAASNICTLTFHTAYSHLPVCSFTGSVAGSIIDYRPSFTAIYMTGLTSNDTIYGSCVDSLLPSPTPTPTATPTPT